MAVEWQLSNNGRTLTILGSNDLQDWVRNFRTRRIGLGERVNRIDRAEALEVLRETREYRRTITTVRGHSRGGAIAQIVARELARVQPIILLTNGTKRTGNAEFLMRLLIFTTWINERNRGDFIPFLPPWYTNTMPDLTDKPWRPVWIAHGDYSW